MVTKCVPCYVFCTTYIILLYKMYIKKTESVLVVDIIRLIYGFVVWQKSELKFKMNFQKGILLQMIHVLKVQALIFN